MTKEIELLRKIADEAELVWDNKGLPLEAEHLKNLLIDRIDFDMRNKEKVKS